MEGGIDDVGLGVLFGLEMYRYEFAGLLMHAEHLEAVHGVGPHTISVPRVKHADDIDPTAFDNGISDDIFAKICALVSASAVPYTGMIISTRESQAVREKVLPTRRIADQRCIDARVSAVMPSRSRRRRIPSSLTSAISVP